MSLQPLLEKLQLANGRRDEADATLARGRRGTLRPWPDR